MESSRQTVWKIYLSFKIKFHQLHIIYDKCTIFSKVRLDVYQYMRNISIFYKLFRFLLLLSRLRLITIILSKSIQILIPWAWIRIWFDILNVDYTRVFTFMCHNLCLSTRLHVCFTHLASSQTTESLFDHSNISS